MDGNYKIAGVMNEEFRDEVKALSLKIDKSDMKGSTVFYGSSSIRLWESLSVDLPEFNCLNIAFGGSKIADCLGFYNDLLGKTTPDRIVFYAGDNDLGDGATAQETMSLFIELFDLIQVSFPNISFLFISVKPSPSRLSFLNEIVEFNEMVKEYLSDSPNASYLDVFSLMMKENGEIDDSIFIEDLLHMNEDGYVIWKNAVREHFNLE